MTSGMEASQTPAEAEQLLSDLLQESKAARDMLATARATETDAKGAMQAVRRRLRFTEECPKPGLRGDGTRVLASYVEDWLDEQVADLVLAYDLAVTARQAASDHVAEMGRQVMAQQSILKSVNEAYRGTRDPSW